MIRTIFDKIEDAFDSPFGGILFCVSLAAAMAGSGYGIYNLLHDENDPSTLRTALSNESYRMKNLREEIVSVPEMAHLYLALPPEKQKEAKDAIKALSGFVKKAEEMHQKVNGGKESSQPLKRASHSAGHNKVVAKVKTME